jgi:hypothetical protein
VVSFQGAVGAQSVSGAFLPSAGVLRGDDDAREHVSGDGRDLRHMERACKVANDQVLQQAGYA